MIFAAAVLFLGMSLLIVANLLHLSDLMRYSEMQGSPSDLLPLWNASAKSELLLHNETSPFNVSTIPNDSLGYENSILVSSSSSRNSESVPFTAVLSSEAAGNETGQNEPSKNPSEVPFKAGLVMVAFILLDIGYDTLNGFTKSFILTCTPRSEHTSVLLVGLVMASAGGVSTAALGVVDFASLLGLSHIEGGSLSIQTTVQGVVVMVLVVLGLLTTLLTGRYQLSQNSNHDDLHTSNDDSKVKTESSTSPDDEMTRSLWSVTLAHSVSSQSNAGVDFDPMLTPWNVDNTESSEKRLILTDKGKDALPNSHNLSQASHYGTQDSASGVALFKDQGRTPRGLKANVAIICISAYLFFGELFLFTYTSSDFAGKAICGGDPSAPPGSESLSRYQEGLRYASWGFLGHCSSYLLMCIVQPRILAVLGYRVEFVLANMMLAISLMTLALTARLEVFFLAAVVAGFQRACFYFVPYAVINDVVQSMEANSGSGKEKVGLAMSLVSACIPLVYCTIYSLVGPLEDLTGMVTIPLWLGTGLGCLSSAVFLFLGKL
ncbi:uncharacterized protein [Littorina saxatilis]